ncbi:MAG: hypothetical protein ACOYN8_12310 [Pseudanabaena sp.]|jgi:hypothetical protein
MNFRIVGHGAIFRGDRILSTHWEFSPYLGIIGDRRKWGNPHLGIFGDPRRRGEHGGIAPTDDILNGKYRFV